MSYCVCEDPGTPISGWEGNNDGGADSARSVPALSVNHVNTGEFGRFHVCVRCKIRFPVDIIELSHVWYLRYTAEGFRLDNTDCVTTATSKQ